jgi:hypothetical protein
MKYIYFSFITLLFSCSLCAEVTLKCSSKDRCDGRIENCVNDPLTFVVNINPSKKLVSLGSSALKADFSNPAKVSFPYLGYTVDINKHESSVVLYNQNEVRTGSCLKVDPAW